MTPFGDAKNPARGLYGGLSGGLARVTAQAVTPEQLLPYVGAVSGLRPRLFGGCVGHTGEGEVVLVGYPLHDPRDTAAVDAAVREALTVPDLSRITVLAAARPAAAPSGAESREDAYWSLPLPVPPVGLKLRNMLRRAARDITVEQSGGPDCWTAEHAALVEDFCRARALEPGSVHIFRQLEAYLAAAPQARLFSARCRDGRLGWMCHRRLLVLFHRVLHVRLSLSGRAAGHGGRAVGGPGGRSGSARARPAQSGPGHSSGRGFFQEKVGGKPFSALCGNRLVRAGGKKELAGAPAGTLITEGLS